MSTATISDEPVLLPMSVNRGMPAEEFLGIIRGSPHYEVLGTGRLPGYTRKGYASIERCDSIGADRHTVINRGANLILRTHAHGVSGGVSDVTYIAYDGPESVFELYRFDKDQVSDVYSVTDYPHYAEFLEKVQKNHIEFRLLDPDVVNSGEFVHSLEADSCYLLLLQDAITGVVTMARVYEMYPAGESRLGGFFDLCDQSGCLQIKPNYITLPRKSTCVTSSHL